MLALLLLLFCKILQIGQVIEFNTNRKVFKIILSLFASTEI
ncbi:MAG: hypothetical protein Rsou_0378 [Candidatus Ruthia sp. Asou_11_S2]|nr:hypothetical protein [Candidatus Ruthia sp. Asou_11_S2]